MLIVERSGLFDALFASHPPILERIARLDPSFVRAASYVDAERATLYPGGVFYCKDAFEGLDTMNALTDPVEGPKLAERVKAWDDGAWGREAALAHERKKQLKTKAA